MLKLKTTTRFEKDYKKAIKSGKDMTRLKRVMTWIAAEQALPTELRDHKLVGNYQGRRECHLSGDWLLIYKLEDDTVIFERLDRIPSCLNHEPNTAVEATGYRRLTADVSQK